MKTFLSILFATVMTLCAAGVNQTKTYRCNADETKIVNRDPLEVQTGHTYFDDKFYPYFFETDSKDAMVAWIAQNKIVYKEIP